MRSFFILSACMLLVAVSARAQKPEEAIPFDKNTITGKLPNGLTYYIRKNAKPEHKAEMRLVVNAGSILERDDQRGVAHFLEHMAFNGTKNFPKNDLLNYLEKAGVRFGADLNATTGFDYTIYMLPIPSNDEKILSNGYQVLRDWAGDLLLDKEEIEKERGIIIEEKRMRQNAGMRTYAAYIPFLTNNSKYGERIPIGKEEIIKTVPRQAFVDFYKDWYRPDNMAIIVVGDIDIAKTETTIRTLFTDLKNPAGAPARPAVTPINWHSKNAAKIITDPENTNNILNVFLSMERAKSAQKWGDYSDELLSKVLSSLFAARLEENYVNPNSPISYGGINPSGSFLKGYKTASLFALVKDNATQAIDMMIAEILKAKQYGFTQSELDRVKKNMLKQYEEALMEKDKTESANYVNEYIEHFLNQEPSPGIETEQKFISSFLNNLKLQQVNDGVKALNLDKPVFILFNAKEAMKNSTSEPALIEAYEKARLQKAEPYVERAVASQLMDKMPVAGKIISREKDDYKGSNKLVLNNGITVIYKKTDFKNDEIIVRGSQWGGNTSLTPEEIKTARFLSLAGSMGLGNNKAVDMSKIMSGVEAYIFLNMSPTQFMISGNGSAKDIEKLMQLFHLKMTAVNFDASEFEGIKTSYASQVGSFLKNTVFKFSDTLNKFKFNNSYRMAGFATEQETMALQLNDLKTLYQKITGNLNGTVIVFTGNIDESNFESLVEKYIASIPTAASPVNLVAANIPTSLKGQNNFTFQSGKENKSEINYSYYGKLTETTDKEVQAFILLGEILQMRANQKLREEMGNTYAPRVTPVIVRPPVSDYSISLVVSALPENTGKIINAFDELVKDIINGNVTAEELQKAQAQRVKTSENFFKTNMYWASSLEQQFSFKFKGFTAADYTKMVESVTKEDIVNVAKKYIRGSSTLKGIMNPE